MEIVGEDFFTEINCGYANLEYSDSQLCQYTFTNILFSMSIENVQDNFLYDLTTTKYIDIGSEYESSCIENCAIEFEHGIPKHVYINDVEFTEWYWFSNTNKYVVVTGVYDSENSTAELIVEIDMS